MFKRGITRDPSVFPKLKDELLNDQWHRTFDNQAKAQSVRDVLNASYKPTTTPLRLPISTKAEVPICCS
jgi:hypothetical protein